MPLATPHRLRGRRAPVVAGRFYPRDDDALATAVDSYLAEGRARLSEATVAGTRVIVAPHAGYVYSGPVAGTAFAALDLTGVRRVVIVGPSHFVPVDGIALPAADVLATPLGTLSVDVEAADTLLAQRGVTVDDRPHAREHSLEVELPFLQRLDPTMKVVVAVVGRAVPETVADALSAVCDAETALVVSTDLSHFLPYDDACRVDRATADTVEAGDPTLTPEQACGSQALNGALVLARRRAWRSRLLDLRSSGDTAGDRDSVVGYGAFALDLS